MTALEERFMDALDDSTAIREEAKEAVVWLHGEGRTLDCVLFSDLEERGEIDVVDENELNNLLDEIEEEMEEEGEEYE